MKTDTVPTGPARERIDADASAARPEQDPRARPAASLARALQHVSAPLGAMRPIFPYRFALAVRRIAEDPSRRSISVAHARRYFGETLVLDVDPRTLQYHLQDGPSDGAPSLHLGGRFLEGGDWSGLLHPVRRSARHHDMLQLTRYGRDYRKMPRYLRLCDLAERGTPADAFGTLLDSRRKIDAYFEYYLDVIESVRRFGFRRQHELPDLNAPRGLDIRGRFAAAEREVGVAIGPDGTLLRFQGGHHRIGIAHALGLPSIPVEVRLVHAGWLRRQAETTGLPADRALTDWIARSAVAASRSPGHDAARSASAQPPRRKKRKRAAADRAERRR